MRLFVGALACFAALCLLSAHCTIADPAVASHLADKGLSNDGSRADWLTLNQPDASPGIDVKHPQPVDPQKDGPVLLPLPPEGWACVMVLTSLACFRGLKRARII